MMVSSTGFKLAVEHVKAATDMKASNDDKLKFYAYYKQATSGDCDASEPSRFSVVAHAKWKAWDNLRGMKKDNAMRAYIETVQRVDSTFKVPMEEESQVVASPVASQTKPAKEESAKPIEAATNNNGPSPFLLSLGACFAVMGMGVIGFLLTTLSHQALFFLGMIFAGLLGVVGCFAHLLDSNGLIALYPSLVQRILLDRTLVEVILDGTIMQRIRDTITEIMPIFYCKTPEDRLVALANMSENTRRIMTTRGIVNLLPEWQQRITLSGSEYTRQKAKVGNQATAYRPALDMAPNGGKLTNPAEPNLEHQRALSSKFFMRNLLDRASATVVKTVNPQFSKGASIALMLSFLIQLQVSTKARQAVTRMIRSYMLSGSFTGGVVFALLAVVHQLAKRYQNKRLKENRV